MAATRRHLTQLDGEFGVARFGPHDAIPAWALASPTAFSSLTRTRHELSVICPVDLVPASVEVSRGWHCLRIDGPFGLDEPGVLDSVVAPLATAGISVFAVATHDTDHLLVTDLAGAVATLTEVGHQIDHESIVEETPA